MSDDLWVADPETAHRRRAFWGLAILGLAAVIFVSLMVFFLGSSGGGSSGLPNTSNIPLSTSPANTHSSSSQHSTSSSASQSSSASSSTSTAATTSCSSGTSCTLDGDAGGVINAINAFRQSNGQPPVPGTTTDPAKNCSLSNGDEGSCPTYYFWEPVSPQNGAAVVQKIASRSDGRSYLLDPGLKAVQVGWAYVGGQFSCTIVAVH